MVPHCIVDGRIVIHDAASAPVQHLNLAVGQKDALEIVVPLIKLFVELRQDLMLEVSYLRWVQQDLVTKADVL